jgi:hypothetical protein
MIADRIANACKEYRHNDNIQERITKILRRYKKSERRLLLTRELRKRRESEIASRLNVLSEKHNVPFAKLNQVLFNNYSNEIKINFNTEAEKDIF